MGKILFVTGTGTGVGKTLLTASLLHHLRRGGVDALAMKPFCSGGREDVELLQALQSDAGVPPDQVNPFYFPEPLAPAVAARRHHRRIRLAQALQRIRAMEHRCARLLVEGAGGLLAPLGERFTAADLIARLGCAVVVVATNRLGTINHTLLTVAALRRLTPQTVQVVLMGSGARDASAATNLAVLRQWAAPAPVRAVPFLGPGASRPEAVKNNWKKMKKVLARLWL